MTSILTYQHKYLVALTSTLLCLCLQTNVMAASDKSGPIKIGFLASLSGPFVENCNTMLRGFQLYLDQHNNEMAGRKVELIVENDSANPETAKEKFTQLVEKDKVDMVSGVYMSSVAYAIAPLADKWHKPLVLSIASADDITQRQRGPWVVRASHTSSQAAHPFGTWVYKNLKYKAIITIGLDYPFGYEQCGGFQETFEKAGGKIVQKIWVPLSATDLTPYIKSMRKDADAVYCMLNGKAAQIMPLQYEQFGPHLPVVANGDAFDETVLSAYGRIWDGSYSCLYYSEALETEPNHEFVTAYRDKYGRIPTPYAERGYTSAMLIDKAVQKVQGNLSDPSKMMAAIKVAKLSNAPRGPMKMDDYGNPVENIYIRKVTKRDNSYVNAVVETIPNVSQFWTFNPKEYLKRPLYSKDYPPCKYCSSH